MFCEGKLVLQGTILELRIFPIYLSTSFHLKTRFHCVERQSSARDSHNRTQSRSELVQLPVIQTRKVCESFSVFLTQTSRFGYWSKHTSWECPVSASVWTGSSSVCFRKDYYSVDIVYGQLSWICDSPKQSNVKWGKQYCTSTCTCTIQRSFWSHRR